MLLYIARHGETRGNREKRFQGHTDFPLSHEGQRQAALLARTLTHSKLDAVYSSDLTRARQTAEKTVALTGAPLCYHPIFREYSFGVVEGMTHSEVAKIYPGLYPHLSRGYFTDPPPGAESLACFKRRLLSAWKFFCTQPASARALLVGHGRFINALLTLIFAEIKEPPYSFPVSPGSLSAARIEAEHAKLLLVNDTSHLEKK